MSPDPKRRRSTYARDPGRGTSAPTPNSGCVDDLQGPQHLWYCRRAREGDIWPTAVQVVVLWSLSICATHSLGEKKGTDEIDADENYFQYLQGVEHFVLSVTRLALAIVW